MSKNGLPRGTLHKWASGLVVLSAAFLFLFGTGFASWAIASSQFASLSGDIHADDEIGHYYQDAETFADFEVTPYGFYPGKGFVGENGVFERSTVVRATVRLNTIDGSNAIKSLLSSNSMVVNVSVASSFPDGKSYSDYPITYNSVSVYVNSAAVAADTDTTMFSSVDPSWDLTLSSLPVSTNILLSLVIRLEWGTSSSSLSSFPDFSLVGLNITLTPKEATT